MNNEYDTEHPTTETTTNKSHPLRQSVFRELLEFAIIVLLVILPIRFFVAQPFVVIGQSMEPTFATNEYLIIDELSYKLTEPGRGQVIVFKYPGSEEVEDGDTKYFIKRIIGLPGETIVIKKGIVTIINTEHPEGFILTESYIKSRGDSSLETTLNEDEYFVMGDNRQESFDSRSWGPLDKSYITGRAFVRLLPPSKASIYPGGYTQQEE